MKDKILLWIARKLPRELVMRCAMRVCANATQGKYSSQIVSDLLFMDAIKRWEGSK